jgi:SAM-dependent methyltransferase
MADNNEWDKRYSNPKYIYGLEPNDYLVYELSRLTPGSILLPAEGEGRNALWAAKQGWEVTAFDYSEVAQQKALQLFDKHGVKVNYSVANCVEYSTYERFDAIGLVFIHLSKQEQPIVFNNLIGMLKPGGHIIMEIFHPNQIERTSGGPKNPNLFLSLNEVEIYFKNITIKYLAKVEVELNEGPLHQGKALVIRMLAQK